MYGKVREFDHDWRVANLQVFETPAETVMVIDMFMDLSS